MRQLFLDTETTGLSAEGGDRVIELGCVELVNRKLTGNNLHFYFNPGRDSHEDALKVHGISNEFLRDKPKFAAVVQAILNYVEGAEIIIHNAAFDVGFLNAELSKVGTDLGPIEQRCRVLDTLLLAREMHPGQRNSLDALCKRYGVDNSKRELHGALLDARILADVYLAMTGGQSALALTESAQAKKVMVSAPLQRPAGTLRVIRAAADEISAHEAMVERIAKASGGKAIFR